MSQVDIDATKHPRTLTWRSGQHRFEPHFHDQLFLGVILHGECQFQSLDRSYVAQAGDVVVIPAFVPHTACCDPNTCYRALYLEEKSFFGLMPPTRSMGLDGTWRANVSIIRDTYLARRLDIALQDSQAPRLREVIAAIIHGHADIASKQPPTEDTGYQLRKMVAAAARQQLSMADVAEQLGCSPSAFSRLFHQQVGMRAVFFRNQLRLLTAEDQLLEGHSICDVATACGFADQAHLTREIKKFRGVTPGTYLSSYQEVPHSPLLAKSLHAPHTQ